MLGYGLFMAAPFIWMIIFFAGIVLTLKTDKEAPALIGVVLAGAFVLSLSTVTICDVDEERVLDSSPAIASISQRDGCYVVMIETGEDGGYVSRSYPAAESVVYEDAASWEDAHVDKVVVTTKRLGGTIGGLIPVSGDVDWGIEYHIHVPEGTLDQSLEQGEP